MGGVNCIQTFLDFWIFFIFTRSLRYISQTERKTRYYTGCVATMVLTVFM